MKRIATATVVVAVFTALLGSTAGGWSNVYGSDSPENYSSAEAVEILPDGSSIVAGCFDGEFNGKTATNGLDTFVMKVSPEGETLWTHTADGSYTSDCWALSIRYDDAGNIFVFHGSSRDNASLTDSLVALDSNGNPLDAVFPGLNVSRGGGVSGRTYLHSTVGIDDDIRRDRTAINANGQFAAFTFDTGANAVVLETCHLDDCATVTETQIDQVPSTASDAEVAVDVTSTGTVVLAANHGDNNAHVTLCLAADCTSSRLDFAVPVGNSGGSDTGVSVAEFADGTPSIVFFVREWPQPHAVLVSCTDVTCTSLSQTTVNLGVDSGQYASLVHAVDSSGRLALLNTSSTAPVVLVRCDDAACSTPTSSTLDRTGDSYAAVFDGDDNLVYQLYANDTSVLVWCGNATCTSESVTANTNWFNTGTKLSVNADGSVFVHGWYNIDRCDGTACAELAGNGMLVAATPKHYTLLEASETVNNDPQGLVRYDFGDYNIEFESLSYVRLIEDEDGFIVLGSGYGHGDNTFSNTPTVINVSATGEEQWAWQPTNTPADYTPSLMPYVSRSDGTGGLIIGVQLDPLYEYQVQKSAFYRLDPDGNEVWSLLVGTDCGFGTWSFVTDTTVILDTDDCEQELPGARVIDLATGQVITEATEAAIPTESGMRIGVMTDPACYEVNDDQTLIVFNYDRCDPNEIPTNEIGESFFTGQWELPMGDGSPGSAGGIGSIDEFAYLGDDKVATIVQPRGMGWHMIDDENEWNSRWFGVFEVLGDGYLRPLKIQQLIDGNTNNDSLRDVAVDPQSGRVVVVGRVDGASSVSLSPLSRSRSLQLQSSSQPNALTVSASSDVAPITHGFEDVPTDGWRSDAVYWLRESGVTKGCSATSFCPEEEMTRAQQLTFLWRYAGKPSAGPVSPFTDVPRGQYFSVPVDWAFNTNVTKGISQDPWLFGTTQSVTRAQAVTFLWRQAGEPEPSGPPTFGDVPAGQFFTDAVAWAAENGVTNGRNANEFDPHAPVKRVEFAAFLSRYDNLNLN